MEARERPYMVNLAIITAVLVQKMLNLYGLGRSRFRVARMEKDMQGMIITIDLLSQKNVIKAQ